jgi:hypothetical protein
MVREMNKKIPRRLELQAEIDYWYWMLDQHIKVATKPLSPIERMVDQATGYEPEIPKEVRYVVAKIKKLRKEYDRLSTPKSNPTLNKRMEDVE